MSLVERATLARSWERAPSDPPVERPPVKCINDSQEGRMALVEDGGEKTGRWLTVDESDLLEVGL